MDFFVQVAAAERELSDLLHPTAAGAVRVRTRPGLRFAAAAVGAATHDPTGTGIQHDPPSDQIRLQRQTDRHLHLGQTERRTFARAPSRQGSLRLQRKTRGSLYAEEPLQQSLRRSAPELLPLKGIKL